MLCLSPIQLSEINTWEMFWIRIHSDTNLDPAFQVNPDPIRNQGFDDQKLKKKIQLKFFFIFLKSKLQFKGVLATGENFSHQKRTSSTSKNEIS
jgi:hypothetical protein